MKALNDSRGGSLHSVNDPSQMAEDSNLRSRHVRELIDESRPLEAGSTPRPVLIPKVIVQFWHDSSAIPADVKECIESWRPLTGNDFKRVFFDEPQARTFIANEFGRPYVDAFHRCEHPAMQCDYFRLCYIVKNGGFYVDSDEVYQGGDCDALFADERLKIQPMCYDTSKRCMVDGDVFWGSKACRPEWSFYVNNNPLIAPPAHPVIRLALERSTRMLLSRSENRFDVQAMTGPMNLTASLVKHSIESESAGRPRDFLLLTHWDAISTSPWSLSYRNDERNWRFWQFLRLTNRKVGLDFAGMRG